MVHRFGEGGLGATIPRDPCVTPPEPPLGGGGSIGPPDARTEHRVATVITCPLIFENWTFGSEPMLQRI